jgi:hypothetical protein
MKDNKNFHHLHQYKYLWATCTKRETIEKAWLKLRKGKTKRKDVIHIENNFDYYVGLMIETIQNTKPGGDPDKAFYPKILTPKYRVEHGKLRKTYGPPIWDQWVHQIILQVLSPIILKYSYKYSCGSMPKRGGLYGKRELERCIKKKGFKYFAKLDIRHFFDNIRLKFVIDELRIFIADEWFLFLIERVYMRFKKGLVLGFTISQWLANFILCRIDWEIMRTKPICSVRYVDDFVICGNNKKKLRKLVKRIASLLGRIKLKLKNNYQIIRFDYNGIGRPIDFMGYLFYSNRIILRKRILFRTTKLANRLKRTTYIAVRQAQSMLSRLGWFKHTNTKTTYIKYIRSRISIEALKNLVRIDQRHRKETEYDNRMARRIDKSLPIAI